MNIYISNLKTVASSVCRNMKYLAVCLLVVAGSCLADLSRRNTYGSYYDKLADECECVRISPLDGRLYEILRDGRFI